MKIATETSGIAVTIGHTTSEVTIADNLTVTGTVTLADGSINLADLDIDGATDIGAAIVDADLFIVDDGAGGTNRKTAASRIKTYVGGGITVADEWRLTTGFTGDVDPIASNWEQIDTAPANENLGSDMAVSSGIWTFPSTGFYLVMFQTVLYDANDRYIAFHINATTDNSSYTGVGHGSGHLMDDDGAQQAKYVCWTIVDVSDTANVKVTFSISANDDDATVSGDSRFTVTGATFIRLGDT